MSLEIIVPMYFLSKCWWYKLTRDPSVLIQDKLSRFFRNERRWSKLSRDPPVSFDIIVIIIYFLW